MQLTIIFGRDPKPAVKSAFEDDKKFGFSLAKNRFNPIV